MTHEERRALIEQYKAGYEEVARSLEGFDEQALSARPVPGKWSAREVVQHLADSEMNSAIRLRKLLTEDDPQIQGYDQEHYAASLRYNERPIAPALDALRGAAVRAVSGGGAGVPLWFATGRGLYLYRDGALTDARSDRLRVGVSILVDGGLITQGRAPQAELSPVPGPETVPDF